ncbi:ral GTPase-activating protein subunit beta isoform X2 [Strongylocentrotus purpuratus]|uniref:Ral GTPase-activating protein subunit beta n=1 Tax=Strongylocentrotus purpuratus TaxID=7668 RepID=A0A7M7PT72_STRPU|nr:ral GTPase-activating protein subunit beta isoform X2 [Strongylocentrotus purpuratus]
MYSGWASLQEAIESDQSNHSVLHTFPETVGRDVAVSVVKQLAASTASLAALQQRGDGSSACNPLESEKQVEWTMEVICYGLSLPLNEHEAIRDCVSVYCEWLKALTIPQPTLPTPLSKDPNPYIQKIFQHLVNLFKPRQQGMSDTNKQAVLCHRVLRSIQSVATESIVMTKHTWEVLLRFLLSINHTLLSPPLESGSLAEQLCERLLSVLFEVWLLACARCFPSPTLWRTFREMCCTWRHHPATVAQWNRINKVLTAQLIQVLYGPIFPPLKLGDDEGRIIPPELDNDGLAQAWFRFLHILGNPVDLCHPEIIGRTPKFVASINQGKKFPDQHSCLQALPDIFLKAMKGLSVLVDAYLGYPPDRLGHITDPSQGIPSRSPTIPSAAPFNAASKAKGVPSAGGRGTSSTNSGIRGGVKSNILHTGMLPGPSHSECNSILHLFGAWLFEAALMGCKFHGAATPAPFLPRRSGSLFVTPSSSSSAAAASALSNTGSFSNTSTINFTSSSTTTATTSTNASTNSRMMRRAQSIPSSSDAPHVREGHEREAISSPGAPSALLVPDRLSSPESYEEGRAEACGTLCRIFTSRKAAESILPMYLSRFYLTLTQGLSTNARQPVSGLVLSNILYNSHNLLRVDLTGVKVLIPYLLSAMDLVIPETDLRFKSLVPKNELRRASIHLLLSMLCLPHHFKDLTIQSIIQNDADDCKPEMTFMSLKPQLVDLMISGFRCESNPQNAQMLLGAMYMCILDSAMSESVEAKTSNSETPSRKESTSVNDSEETAENAPPGSSLSGSLFALIDAAFQETSNTPITTVTDTAWAIFVRCCHLVFQQLMSTWSKDCGVAMAALELLSGVARIPMKVQDPLECKRNVKWICDHIAKQCNQPSVYHSRDLHSIIVAAFNCLTVWVVEHSYLLKDRETLQIVLEVVELGISGTKSQPKASIPAVLKQAKELKPTSTRVKNAAQGVLSCILNQLGSFPAPCGPSTVVSLLDETSLLKYVDLPNPEVKPTFKYFVMDNSILLAMLEEPLKFTKELLPTVTVIIRGPTGRHVWTFQLRHSSRKDKETAEARLIYPERPQPNDSMGTHHEITSKYFPDSINKIPITKADQSIPSLDEIETEESHEDHVTLGKLLQDQMEYEKLVSDTAHEETERVSYPNPQTESRPPKPCTEFSPARLLLSHLGYLNIESLQGPENSSLPPALVAIDDTQAGFTPDLLHLDEIPSRTFDTAFIFYVKTGQKKAEDILFNVKSKDNVQYQFLEFLQALGWPVVIGQHAGWTGHMTTSWKIPDFDANTKTQSNGNVKEELSHGGSLYSGKKQVLYFADFSSEIAFVVPTDDEPKVASNDDATQLSPVPEEPNPAQPPSSSTQQGVQPRPADLEASGSSSNSSLAGSLAGSLERPSRKFSTKGVNATPPELKVLVVWLENFEDHQTFPLADLLHKTSTGSENLTTSNNSLSKTPEPSIMIIYIHLLKSGLFRIHIQSSCTLAIPLVDGMVVSRRTLGTLVRQTVVNTCNRKRLESEKYSPPHVRRRQRIQEMVQKYQRKQSVSEFYTSLFTS